jgi:antibiotic biosynthesis monooxygenase (ABM) superfamily enzyme
MNTDVKPENKAEWTTLAEELGRIVRDDSNYIGRGKNRRIPLNVGRQAEIIKRMKELEK